MLLNVSSIDAILKRMKSPQYIYITVYTYVGNYIDNVRLIFSITIIVITIGIVINGIAVCSSLIVRYCCYNQLFCIYK